MDKIENIIFLDFDGVISTPAVQFNGLDPECMARLKRLVDETNAFIVITSVWRKLHSLMELKEMLLKHGIERRVLGVTDVTNGRRDEEIQAWLNMRHPMSFQIKNIVVIDDDSFDLTAFEHVLVKPNTMDGLQDEHVEQAINILNGEPNVLS
jgi:hypothetical protein